MFLQSRQLRGMTAPIVYMDATASVVYKVGETLKASAGAVTRASATEKPTHICVGPASVNGVPCVEVLDDMEFETTLSAAGTSLSVGDKVTISADGLQVTATTTGGVAEITGMEGTAVGSKVTVKFRVKTEKGE